MGPEVELQAIDFIDSKYIDEITFNKAYEMGLNCGPHYTVPAIPLEVVWTPAGVDSIYYNSILIIELSTTCSCCGGTGSIVAAFDFDFDRCCDFFFPLGEYVNSRQIDEGTAAYREFRELNKDTQ